MGKNLHILFGSAKSTLLQSVAFNLDEMELICLNDTSLSVGPLLGMDSEEAVERRKKWLVELYEDPLHPTDEWIDGLIENDRKAIADFLKYPEEIPAIYLWTGYCSNEILAAARFVSSVAGLGKPVFQINFPNIPVRIWNGEIIHPESLAVMNPENIHSLVDHFLQRHGTGEFKKVARVIGETLADVERGVGDGFLNWRLKQLCRDGKLEYRGELRAIRDYEVRSL